MRVNGEKITDAQQAEAIHAMQQGPFNAGNIADALFRAGVRNDYRAADRIIQKQRKLGNISFAKDKWTWNSGALAQPIAASEVGTQEKGT